MTYSRNGNSIDLEFKKFGITFWLYNQWPGFIYYSQHNWHDFTFCKLHFEIAPYKDQVDFEFSLLGFNIGIDFWRKIMAECINCPNPVWEKGQVCDVCKAGGLDE